MKEKFYVISMIVLSIFVAGLAFACIVARWDIIGGLFGKIVILATLVGGLYQGIRNAFGLMKG